MELTDDLLGKCIKELRDQQRSHKVYGDYYRGQHDILRDYSFNESRSNQKVVVNFFKRFVDAEVAYSLGNPVSYVDRNNDTDLINTIDLNFTHWEKIHNQELLKNSAIFGFAFELQFINKDLHFRATVLNPLNMLVIESGNAERDVAIALHNYKENKFSDNEMLDVYHDNKIYTYKLDGDKPTLVTERQHTFDGVPVVVNEYNRERQSLLDSIKTVGDSYNNVLSDQVNESSDFRMAMLAITGAKLEPEDADKMKSSGVLQLAAGAEIKYLIKDIPDTFTRNTLETLEEKLYTLSSHINHEEGMVSNISGVALRSRMISLENKCSLLQALMESTIKKRLRNFFMHLKMSEGIVDADYRSLKVVTRSNIPSDSGLLADEMSKLTGIISQRSIISQLGFIENPDHEIEQFYKEQRNRRAFEMEGQLSLDDAFKDDLDG